MASTRNLNTKYDYLCEKKQNNKMLEYMTDKTYGVHENPAFWDLGSNPSMYAGNLSHNEVDVESKLRGIRSVNLEGNSFNPTMQEKKVGCEKLFERTQLYIPSSYTHNPQERPMYLN